MKKIRGIAAVLALVLAAGLLTGCWGRKDNNETTQGTTENRTTEQATTGTRTTENATDGSRMTEENGMTNGTQDGVIGEVADDIGDGIRDIGNDVSEGIHDAGTQAQTRTDTGYTAGTE